MNSSTPWVERMFMVSVRQGRGIDVRSPVRVYRNLQRKTWSIQQDGLVVAYAPRVVLTGCKFHVNEAGRERVLRDKRKNVHAYISGELTPVDEWIDYLCFNESRFREDYRPRIVEVTYNPYMRGDFVTSPPGTGPWTKFSMGTQPSVHNADTVYFNTKGKLLVAGANVRRKYQAREAK